MQDSAQEVCRKQFAQGESKENRLCQCMSSAPPSPMSCQIYEFELLRITCLSLRDAALKHKLPALELVRRT